MSSRAAAENNMLLSSLSQLCSQMPSSASTTTVVGEDSRTTRLPRRRARLVAGEGDDGKKRRLSDAQVKFLEMSFRDERKLESGRKVHLAAELGLDPKVVAVWFQNRRARHKNKLVEDAYAKLKAAHEAVVVQKCHLENEVLKLREKILEAEEEIKKLSTLSAAGAGVSGSSGSSSCQSSSFSAVSHQPPLIGDQFGAEGAEDDLISMYMHEYNNFNTYNMMEWANFYNVV